MLIIEYIIYLTRESEDRIRRVFTLTLKVIGYNYEGQHRVLTVNV